ncbi:MAG: urease accessory protein UreD [Myxococcota bacterium]
MSETSDHSEVIGQSPWPVHGRAHPAGWTGWDARLSLEIGRRHGRTRVLHQRHEGPLLIQKPFHPRNHDSCQIVIVHPPGGIVGGDRLEIEIEVGPQAHALVTTPGATRFYRTAGHEASQQADLRVREGACLEWTPQETLLFDASRSRISTRVELDPGARFLGWDIFGLGRPASGSCFNSGVCRQDFSLSRAGHPLWIERNEYRGGAESLTARWGLRVSRQWGHCCAAVVMPPI